jgi:hypothetical protein
VGAGEPVLTQTRVDRFLSSPQRVDVGMIGGQAGRHLGTLGDCAVAGEPSMPGSTRINPPSPRTAMALLQTHALCRTQTPSATRFSIG